MPAWSWKRALIHAGLAFVAVVAVGAAAFAAFGSPDSNAGKFGEGVGRLSTFTAAVVFGASWLRQTGRRKTAVGVVAGWVVLVGGVFAVLFLVPPRARHARRQARGEPARLLAIDERGQRRLRHSALGFSLLHPGPAFQEAPDVVRAMAGARPDPDTEIYGFKDETSQSAFVVSVMYGMGGSQEKLARHIDGVESGLTGSAAGGLGVRRLARQITWEDGRPHVARLSLAVGGDAHVELAAYSVEPPGGEPFIVNLMVTTRAPEKFGEVLASLRP